MKPATQVLQSMKNAILEARSKRASSSKKPRKAVSIKMRQEWTEEQAKSLLPPNSTIRRDPFDGRWQVFYGSGPAIERWSKSRSWGIAGGGLTRARNQVLASSGVVLAAHTFQWYYIHK